MTADNRPLGKALPFGAPKDYQERNRFIRAQDYAPDLYQQLQSSQSSADPWRENADEFYSAGRPEARKSATMSYREIIRHAWAEIRDYMLDNPRIGYPIVLAAGIVAGLAAIAIPSLILTGRIVF